jgi:hypothetical protein
MTEDEIIEMARQVGYPIQHPEWQKATEEFAALVAAKEREACAKLFPQPHMEYFGQDIQDAIRARGEQA